MHEEYAEALLKTIESGITPKKAVKSLHAALTARGRQLLMAKIARSFSRMVSRIESRDAVILKVSRKTDVKPSLKNASPILRDRKISPAEVRSEVDETLIGGWRLEGREMLRDASYKKQLLDIYEKVSGK